MFQRIQRAWLFEELKSQASTDYFIGAWNVKAEENAAPGEDSDAGEEGGAFVEDTMK